MSDESLMDEINALESELEDMCAEIRAKDKEIARLREALKDIGDADPVDMALDPQWPARIARAARAEQEK